MYALLLAFRYLRTRLIPLVAIGAVGLCVALVVVVVSIMSGFLYQMERAGKTLIGDVVVTNGLRGLPDPEGFIAELKQERSHRGRHASGGHFCHHPNALRRSPWGSGVGDRS